MLANERSIPFRRTFAGNIPHERTGLPDVFIQRTEGQRDPRRESLAIVNTTFKQLPHPATHLRPSGNFHRDFGGKEYEHMDDLVCDLANCLD
jgi:hypothetical protein